MKKFLVLFSFVFIFFSCLSDDNNYQKYHLEILSVEEVEIPDTFLFGETYTIKLYYTKKSTCHYPDGIYYESDQSTRVIAVQNIVVERNDCSAEIPEEDLMQEMSFEFKVTQQIGTSYIFKFYKGQDYEGQNNFLVVEVPVIPFETTP